jgi:hypothetical protein
MTQELQTSLFLIFNLTINNINKIAPTIAKILFIGITSAPKPIYLLAVINKSTNKEYPVKDL